MKCVLPCGPSSRRTDARSRDLANGLWVCIKALLRSLKQRSCCHRVIRRSGPVVHCGFYTTRPLADMGQGEIPQCSEALT